MDAAILSIGTELTRGELVNTNASWLAARLTGLGFEVTRIDCVDDDIGRIVESLRALCPTHGVIVATGGLGPTTDDLTTEAVAKLTGVALVRDEASLRDIEDKFRRFGRVMPASNAKQADFPAGAEILANANGTAPGFCVTYAGARAYFMPGVPREMHLMFDAQVTPRIAPLAPQNMHQIRLLTYGKPESEVGELLAGVEAAHPGVTLGYRAHFPEIEVKVLARAADQTTARAEAEAAALEVQKRLGDIVFGSGDVRFPEVVAKVLREQRLTLALAESCTGGLCSQLLTEAPASDYFIGGTVTYANSAKTTLLGVSEALLASHGAVSAEVAAAMAEGARTRFASDIAASITGIAGPTGGTNDKPVGTVHIGISSQRETKTHAYVFRGDRARIQRHAAYQAFKLIVLCARAFQR